MTGTATPSKTAAYTVLAMLSFRNPGWKDPETESFFTPHPAPVEHPPLIQVARDERWFKVDSEGAYR